MSMGLQFDPALKELLLRHAGDPFGEGLDEDAGPEVAVVIGLRDADDRLPGVREVARLGHVITARVPLGRIVTLRRHPAVATLKASTLYVGDLARSVADIGATPVQQRQAVGREHRGRGVVIAVLDWGLDFVHEAFRHPDGRSRLLALWDQRGGPHRRSPAPYGYGREFSTADIDAALQTPDPYATLGYDPARSDPRGEGSHGTHVTSIAAGSGRHPGVAPGADILFVHLHGSDTRPEDTLGDSARLLEAVDYVLKKVGERPVVINFSLGRTGDAKDGSSPVEQALDAVLREKPGRAICMSTGNYYQARLHASGHLAPGRRRSLKWQLPPSRREAAEMEIWYPGDQRLALTLVAPDGRVVSDLPAGESRAIRERGRLLASLHHRLGDPNNGDNQIDLFLHPEAMAGEWQVRLEARRGSGTFHAWIERGRPPQSRFAIDDANPTSTIGTICTGFSTLACGAYDPSRPNRPLAPFSSAGPTRDLRQVPALAAPGVGIVAAKSSSPDLIGLRGRNEYVAKSGTSMAAPHVAGVMALLMEAAAPRRPTAVELRSLLQRSARPVDRHQADALLRAGAGLLDARAALRHLAITPIVVPLGPRRLATPSTSHEETTMYLPFEKTTSHWPNASMAETLSPEDFGFDEFFGYEDDDPLPYDAETPLPYEEVDEHAPLPTTPNDGWVVPPATRRAGRTQHIKYDDAPAWTGTGRECAGGTTPGARQLRCYLLANFPGIHRIGGYACRPNTANRSKLSVHGTGRALDIMIPMQGRRANSAIGDPIANWLVENATDLGVQYLIWNRVRWSGSRGQFARYTGPSPHSDHIHVEINLAAAKRELPWYQRTTIDPGRCINVDLAVRKNLKLARRLGWQDRIDDIVAMLGFSHMTPNARRFARAIARWQKQQGLGVDGVIGPRTWRRLQRELDAPRPWQVASPFSIQ